jgi:hypothetical protein
MFRARILLAAGCIGFSSLVVVPAARAGAIANTVDSAGDVGTHTSLQLNGGNPVISYRGGVKP